MADRLHERNKECTTIISKPLPQIIEDAIKADILEKSKSLTDLKEFELREKGYSQKVVKQNHDLPPKAPVYTK